MTSVNTTLIRIIYPRAQLGRGILSTAPWPWLFAVNIPIGLVALTLSGRFLPANPVRADGRRFDWRDALLNALTFGLLIASIEGFSHDLDPAAIAAMLAASACIGLFFVRSQLRKPRPLLPFDLLRIPIFSVSILTSVCSYTAQMLAMVALPFFLQHECGCDEVRTGLILTAWPAVIMIAAPTAGMLVGRVHAGVLGGAGLAAMAAGLAALALLPGAPSAADIVWRLMLCGTGFALFQSPNNSVLIASSPADRSGSASGMLATARLLGQTSGAALAALLFERLPDTGTRTGIALAGGFALAGALLSFSRLRLPLPAGLEKRRRVRTQRP